MHNVFVVGQNAITSLGFTLAEHIDKIKNNISGVKLIVDKILFPESFYASLIETYCSINILLLSALRSPIQSLNNYSSFLRIWH